MASLDSLCRAPDCSFGNASGAVAPQRRHPQRQGLAY